MAAFLPGSLDVGYLYEIPNTLEKRSHEPTSVDVTTNVLALPSYPEKGPQSISRGFFHGDTSYLANVSLDVPSIPTAAPLLTSTNDDSDDELLACIVPVGVAATVLAEHTKAKVVDRGNANDNDHDHISFSTNLTPLPTTQQIQRRIPATGSSAASVQVVYSGVPTTPLNVSSTPTTATAIAAATAVTASTSPATSPTSATRTSKVACATTSAAGHKECATMCGGERTTLPLTCSSPSSTSASTSVSAPSRAPSPPAPTAQAHVDAAFLVEADTRLAALTATSFSPLPSLPRAPDVCDVDESLGAKNPDKAPREGSCTDVRANVCTEAVTTIYAETTDTRTPVPSTAYIPVPPVACAERVYLQQLRRALRVARAMPCTSRKTRTSMESAGASHVSAGGSVGVGGGNTSGKTTDMGPATNAGTGTGGSTDGDTVRATSDTNTGIGIASTVINTAPMAATLQVETHTQTQTKTCVQPRTRTRAYSHTCPRDCAVFPPRTPVPALPLPTLPTLSTLSPPAPAPLHCSFVLLPFSENMFAPLLTSREPMLSLSDALNSPLALLPLALSLDALLRASGPIDYLLPIPCTTPAPTTDFNVPHAMTRPLITSTLAAASSMDASDVIPCTALAPSLCLAALAAAATIASGASAPQVLDFTLAHTTTLASTLAHVDMGIPTDTVPYARRANDTPSVGAASIAAQTRSVKLPLPREHPYLSAARMHAHAHRHAPQGQDSETESSSATHSFSPLHAHHAPPPPPLTPTHVSLPIAPVLLPHPVRHGIRHTLSSLLALREPEPGRGGAGRPLLASARVLVIGSVENMGAVLQALLSLNTHATQFTVRINENTSNTTATHARVMEPARVITSAATDAATASVASPALVLRDATPLPFDAVAPALMVAAAVVRLLRMQRQQQHHAHATKAEVGSSDVNDGGDGSGSDGPVKQVSPTSSSSPVPAPSAAVLFPFADECLTWLQTTRFPFDTRDHKYPDSTETPVYAPGHNHAHVDPGSSVEHARIHIRNSLPPAPTGFDVSLPEHARALMHAIVATHVHRTATALRAMRAAAQGVMSEGTQPTQDNVPNAAARALRSPVFVGGVSAMGDNNTASTAGSSTSMSNGSADARNCAASRVGGGPRLKAASGHVSVVGNLARPASSPSLPPLPSATDVTIAASAVIPEWFPHPLRTNAAPSLPPLSLTELSLLHQPLPAAHRYRQAAATAGEAVRASAQQTSTHGSVGVVVASTGNNTGAGAGGGGGATTGHINGTGAKTGTTTTTDDNTSTKSGTGSGNGTSVGVNTNDGVLCGAGPSTVDNETDLRTRTRTTTAIPSMSVGAAARTSAVLGDATTTAGTGADIDADAGTGTASGTATCTGVERARACVCWNRGCVHCAGRGCSAEALSAAGVNPSGAFGAVWAMRGDVDNDVVGDVADGMDLKLKSMDKGTTVDCPTIEDGCMRSAEVVVWSEGDWWGEAAGVLCHELWRAGLVESIERTHAEEVCETQGNAQGSQAVMRGTHGAVCGVEVEEDKGLGLLCGGSWLCWPIRTLLTQVHGNVLGVGAGHGVHDGTYGSDGGGGGGLGLEEEGDSSGTGPSVDGGDDVSDVSRHRRTRVGASTTTLSSASTRTNARAHVFAHGHRHAPAHTNAHAQGHVQGRTRWAAAAQSSHAHAAHGSSGRGISQPAALRGGSRGVDTASKQLEPTRNVGMGMDVGHAKAALPTYISTTTTASRLLRVTLLPLVLDPSRTGRGYTAASRDRLHTTAERLSLCTDMRVAVGGRALYMLPDQPTTDTFAYLTRVLGWAVRGRVVQPAESEVAPSMSLLLPALLCGATEAEVLILCRAQDVFDVVEGVLRPEQREAAVQMLDRIGALELRCAIERTFSRRYTRNITSPDSGVGALIESVERLAEDEESGAGWGYRLSSATLGNGGEDADHGVFADARVPVSADSGVSLACAPILHYHHERPLVVAMPARTRVHSRGDIADDNGNIEGSIMPSALYTPHATHHFFLDPRVHPRAHTLHTGHVLAQSGSSGAELHASFMHARTTVARSTSTFSKWLWRQLAQRPFAPARAHAMAVSSCIDTRTRIRIGCSRLSNVGTTGSARIDARDESLTAIVAQSLLAGLHPMLGYALTHATHAIHTTSTADAHLARVHGASVRSDSLLGAARRYARVDGAALAHATVHKHDYYADEPDSGEVDVRAMTLRLSSVSPQPPALVPPIPALQPVHLPQPLPAATSAYAAHRALTLAHPADPALPAAFMHATTRRATQRRGHAVAVGASDNDGAASAERSEGDEAHTPCKSSGLSPALPPLRSLLSASPSERAALTALQSAFMRTRATTGPSLALLARDRGQGGCINHRLLLAPLAMLAKTLDTWAPVAPLLPLPSTHTLAPHPLLGARDLTVQMPPQSSTPTPSFAEALPAAVGSLATPSGSDVAPGSHQVAFNAFTHHRDLLRQYHAGVDGDVEGTDVYASRRGSIARARGPVRYGEELEGGGAGGAAEWVSDEDDSSTASILRGSVVSDEAEHDALPPSLLPVRSMFALSTRGGMSADPTPRLALRQLQGVDVAATPSKTSLLAHRSRAATGSNASSASAPPLSLSRAGTVANIHGFSRPTSALLRMDRDLSVSVNDSFSLLTAQPLSRLSTPQQQTRGERPAGSAASMSTTSNGRGGVPQTRGDVGEGATDGRSGTSTGTGNDGGKP